MTPSRIYLRPAQWCFCDSPTVVETVLGSCVALVLWSRGFGSISHAVLPEQGRFREVAALGPATFVDACVDPMFGWFAAKGIPAAEIQAKIFGGAGLLRTGAEGCTYCTGTQNVKVCRRMLAERSVTPRIEDVGGNQGRKLFFHSHTGAVYVKRLSMTGVGL